MTITEQRVRDIALFFLLSVTDEKTALHAAHDAIAQLKASQNQSQGAPEILPYEIMRVCFRLLPKYLKTMPRSRSVLTSASSSKTDEVEQIAGAQTAGVLGATQSSAQSSARTAAWLIPEGVNKAVWIKFYREASSDEITTLIFAKILNYPETQIAEALVVSIGTVRFRIGKAVRQLGLASASIKGQKGKVNL
jgi:hypothetical protein